MLKKEGHQRAGEDRLEVDHRLAGEFSGRGHRKTQVVLHALEDRDLSQDPEIGLQSGGVAAANSSAAGQSDRGFLHPQLEDFLADDDESRAARRFTKAGIHGAGNSSIRSAGKRKRIRKSTKLRFPPISFNSLVWGATRPCGDSPPGNQVIWKGLSRLTDIELGFLIGAKLVGN